MHPSLPLLATASGQRKFVTPCGDDSSDEDSVEPEQETFQGDNSLRIWSLRPNASS